MYKRQLVDNKEIYDIVSSYDLDAEEKSELASILKAKIGEKPAPKNKAKIKWAIKIYELLGL